MPLKRYCKNIAIIIIPLPPGFVLNISKKKIGMEMRRGLLVEQHNFQHKNHVRSRPDGRFDQSCYLNDVDFFF